LLDQLKLNLYSILAPIAFKNYATANNK